MTYWKHDTKSSVIRTNEPSYPINPLTNTGEFQKIDVGIANKSKVSIGGTGEEGDSLNIQCRRV